VTRFLLFGGKGGVGKTTCAVAQAIAEAGRGRRMLVVSTDPAHSLGDVLRKRLTSRPAAVRAGRTRFLALELNAARAFARWLGRHRRPLGDILEQGTWLDREDVEALLDLSLPGIDELAALLEITRLSRSGVADMIVVDTAPTGHTLRLIAAPETVGAVARVLDALHEEHRLIRDRLARVGRPEASDRLIELLAEQAGEMAAQLRDRSRTTVHWVTLPEALSVAEAGDAVSSLARSGLQVEEIIVNRLLPEGGPCPLCDRRRAEERRVVAEIRRGIGRGRRVRVVFAEQREPVGVTALGRIGRELARGKTDGKSLMAEKPASSRCKPLAVGYQPSQSAVHLQAVDALARAQFLFFGGKGGVGKTTVAAATALRVARTDPSRRVLLISTDPAHSLADALATAVGDTATTIAGAPGNLQVRELDADRAYAARRAAIEEAIGDLAGALGAGGLGANTARVSELLGLAPPGVDELFGMLSIFEARSDFDTIVIDTAPTGHTLRLLALPALVREWVQALLRVLLKYRALLKPGQLAAELVGLSRSIGEFRRVLQQPGLTRFIVVARPAELPLDETVRLLRELRRLRIAVPAIVANALTLAPGRCARCRVTASAERRHLARLRRTLGGPALSKRNRRVEGPAIIQTPLSAPPPRGSRALEEWARQWLIADS
jgi:arsenite/tail-anchored protein-transporting ATPase